VPLPPTDVIGPRQEAMRDSAEVSANVRKTARL